MKTIFILLCIVLSTLYAQEWVDISPFDDESAIVFASFISSENGWTVNASSDNIHDVYYTSDSGDNWSPIYTFYDSTNQISSITMIDSLTGWITLNDYYEYTFIYKTLDGGVTWTDMSQYFVNLEDMTSYHFIDENTGFYAVNTYPDLLPNLYKTTDGGITWDVIDVPSIIINDTQVSYTIKSFFFLNDQIGWAGCNYSYLVGEILMTYDGGQSWTALGNPGLILSSVEMMSFRNEEYGAVLCHGCIAPYVVLTNDYFETFTQLPYDLVQFQSDEIIWCINQGISTSSIYKSEDSGDSFELINQFDSYIFEIDFFGNIGYFTGNQNTLLRYRDLVSNFDDEIPDHDLLFSVYPNPFNPSLTIELNILYKGIYRIEIFNSVGKKVKNYTPDFYQIGNQSIFWDGVDDNGNQLSSGLYYIKLAGDNHLESVKKCVLIK